MKTLKYAIRFLTRSKSYTLINLLGLAFSLACCIILMRYIHRELTVDTHCIDREQVYGIKQSLEGSDYISGISNYGYDPVKLDKSLIEIETTYTPLDEDFLIANALSVTNNRDGQCVLQALSLSTTTRRTCFGQADIRFAEKGFCQKNFRQRKPDWANHPPFQRERLDSGRYH